ncbi:unnamed protein product, partial [Ectocarpus sp. 12 AP-2014]
SVIVSHKATESPTSQRLEFVAHFHRKDVMLAKKTVVQNADLKRTAIKKEQRKINADEGFVLSVRPRVVPRIDDTENKQRAVSPQSYPFSALVCFQVPFQNVHTLPNLKITVCVYHARGIFSCVVVGVGMQAYQDQSQEK